MEFCARKIIDRNEIDNALKLAEKTFMEFEAPEYPEEGVQSFLKFLYGGEIDDRIKAGTIVFYGAFGQADILAGVCAVRDTSHISLMFTHRDFHRQGIGRMLMRLACDGAASQGAKKITLNASPYGLPFYKAIGFAPVDMEQIVDGIIFTPMELILKD